MFLYARRSVIALVTTVMVLLALTQPAMACPAAENVKLCQQGGWKTLYTSTGGTFSNQGACVSYARRGGTFGAAPVKAQISFGFRWIVTRALCESNGGSYCQFTATAAGSGLKPGSAVLVHESEGAVQWFDFNSAADANGKVSYSFSTPCHDVGAILTVTATASSGAPYSVVVPEPTCAALPENAP